jgi:hypothetical protein
MNDILRWFDYTHLPEDLQVISREFNLLATRIVGTIPPGRERSAGLRKLLEAKDAIVRAKIEAREPLGIVPARPTS